MGPRRPDGPLGRTHVVCTRFESNTASERAFPWWGYSGISVFGVGVWLLAADVPVWNTVWYLPAWYGYLLVLDGLILRSQGRSFLSDRRSETVALLFWSVPFWFLYEAYNLVIENWYYVFGLRSDTWGFAFSAAAFATVLPACFLHAEWLKSMRRFRTIQCRGLRVTWKTEATTWVVGAACAILPLIWPRYAFWLVWGATLGIPEAVNYRLGAPSLLRDLENGRPGRLLRLLYGGAWAGVVWEGFNYWSRCKWIYTVPGLEGWKLFEMPLPGFLGFPVLAVNGFACYALLCHALRGGRGWEGGGGFGRPVRFRCWVAAVLAVLFSVSTYGMVQEKTQKSRRPLMSELAGLDAQDRERLRAAGISTPERLYRASESHEIPYLSGVAGVDSLRLKNAILHAELAIHKGMGCQAATLLRNTGVDGVAGLASANAETLYGRIKELKSEVRKPSLAEVRVWVRAADPHGKPRR